MRWPKCYSNHSEQYMSFIRYTMYNNETSVMLSNKWCHDYWNAQNIIILTKYNTTKCKHKTKIIKIKCSCNWQALHVIVSEINDLSLFIRTKYERWCESCFAIGFFFIHWLFSSMYLFASFFFCISCAFLCWSFHIFVSHPCCRNLHHFFIVSDMTRKAREKAEKTR